jgi:hypothetical protein
MIENLNDKAKQLRKACGEAYKSYPDSCSHSVWYVISKYKNDQQYMIANKLLDYIASSPDWKEVQLNELSQLANDGILVVGGKKEHGNGHVIVVYPGDEKARGGYFYEGSDVTISEKGSYARAMSTSMGSWPGAMSNGDKTVWDAWGSDKKMITVRFWKFVGPIRSDISQLAPTKTIKKAAGAKRHHKQKWQAKATNKRHDKWSFKTITDCTDVIAAKWQKLFH